MNDMDENKKITAGNRYCPVIFVVLALLLFFLSHVIYDSDKLETVQYYRDGIAVTEMTQGVPLWVDNVFSVSFIADVIAGLACWIFVILDKAVNRRKILKRVLIMFPVGAVFFFISLLGISCVNTYRGTADGSDFVMTYNPEYYEYSHDDKRIVVCEYSWLLGGFGSVYQVTPDDRMIEIGHFGTDDGYRNQGQYDIEWEEDGVRLTYTFDPIAHDPVKEVFCNWADD